MIACPRNPSLELAAVLAFLPGWQRIEQAEQDWMLRYQNGSGERFAASWETSYGKQAGKRINFYALFPDGINSGLNAGERRPSVTVSATRAPNHIAKELQRRFFPELSLYAGKVRDELRNEKSRKQRVRDARRSVADALGETAPLTDQGDDVHTMGNPVWGSFRVNGAGKDFHIDLRNAPVALAVEIARLLHGYGQAQPQPFEQEKNR